MWNHTCHVVSFLGELERQVSRSKQQHRQNLVRKRRRKKKILWFFVCSAMIFIDLVCRDWLRRPHTQTKQVSGLTSRLMKNPPNERVTSFLMNRRPLQWILKRKSKETIHGYYLADDWKKKREKLEKKKTIQHQQQKINKSLLVDGMKL